MHLARFMRILSDAPLHSLQKMVVIEAYLGCLDPLMKFEVKSRHSSELNYNDDNQLPSLTQLCQWAKECDDDIRALRRSGEHAIVVTPVSRPHAQPGGSGLVHHVSTQTTSTMGTSSVPSSSSTPRSFAGVSPNYKGKNPDPNYQPRGPKTQQGGADSKGTASPPPSQTPPVTAPVHSTGSTGFNAPRCYNCGHPGHLRNNCPAPKGQGGQVKREAGQRPSQQ